MKASTGLPSRRTASVGLSAACCTKLALPFMLVKTKLCTLLAPPPLRPVPTYTQPSVAPVQCLT